MKPILIEEIIKAVNGIINKNIDTTKIFIENISIDTRTIKEGDLFIAIAGENFDGHNFIENAFEKGAKACISEKNIETEGILIKVEDTKKALKDLAKYYRNLFKIPIVAITGSTGKTTTKDIVASVLAQKYNVLKTEGNFNNEIGLPLTIFRMNEKTEVAVLEMGMNHFGEIHNLSEIAQHNIGIITNIGVSHIENLGSRKGILRAKYEIFDFANEDCLKILNLDDDMLAPLKIEEEGKKIEQKFYRKGILRAKYEIFDFANEDCLKILNLDDDMLAPLKIEEEGKKIEQKFYSIEKEADVYATDIKENGLNGISAKIKCMGEEFDLNMKISGKHMLSNALASVIVGKKLGLSNEQIKKGIETFIPSKMRMDIFETEKYTIINDVYNANPNSMKASIDVLANAKGRKIAILGDMFELGKDAPKFHYEIGEYAAKKGIDELIFIGELAKNMMFGAKDISEKENINVNINYFEKQEDFFEKIDNILKKNDNILIKASRGMKFEKTVDKIMR